MARHQSRGEIPGKNGLKIQKNSTRDKKQYIRPANSVSSALVTENELNSFDLDCNCLFFVY
jgi:hypothetical protein